MQGHYQLLRRHDRQIRTSGDLTLNSNLAWANVDTGLDIILPAEVDDVIEVSMNALVGSEAVVLLLDVATVVNTTLTNSFGNRGAVTASPPKYGIAGWHCTNGAFTRPGAPYHYTVVAGDIYEGKVKLRLRYCTDAAANKTLYAGANYAFEWAAKNLGPEWPY